jgi:3-dehydroquinate dehydratase / shikimate dehydrogenase
MAMADPLRMIAIALGRPTMAEALATLPAIRREADCLELRLDLFEEAFDLPLLLRERADLPTVVTLRPIDQGGKSRLTAAERLTVLLQAAELGAEYVDLEWDAATPAAVEALKHAGARVVVSRHDFSSMPPELGESWVDDLIHRNADVIKVVGTAHDVRDCLPVFRAFKRADRPTIAIAMGEAGLLTRVLALREACCFLTYAAPAGGGGTAPGQLTVRDLRETYAAGRLQSSTRVYGLLGPHAETERATEYNRWFGDDAVDAVAVPFSSHSDAPAVVDSFRELPVAGWHVHGGELQSTVGQALDDLAPTACRQGKVNAIVADPSGSLHGHWVESPREQYELWLHSAA